jgi:hypothetical protein
LPYLRDIMSSPDDPAYLARPDRVFSRAAEPS